MEIMGGRMDRDEDTYDVLDDEYEDDDGLPGEGDESLVDAEGTIDPLDVESDLESDLEDDIPEDGDDDSWGDDDDY